MRPRPEPWFQLAKLVCLPPIKLWFTWRFEGLEHIPPTGAAVVACNHLVAAFTKGNNAGILEKLGREHLDDSFGYLGALPWQHAAGLTIGESDQHALLGRAYALPVKGDAGEGAGVEVLLAPDVRLRQKRCLVESRIKQLRKPLLQCIARGRGGGR